MILYVQKMGDFEQDTEYRLILTAQDMLTAPLDAMDRLLLRECRTSGKISDVLLGLETIARRIERHRESENCGERPA